MEKIKILVTIAIVVTVMFVSSVCRAKDLGVITLKSQTNPILSETENDPSEELIVKDNSSTLDLGGILNEIAAGWKGVAEEIQQRLGIEWDKKLGVVVYNSGSLKGGIKSSDNGLKLSFETSF